MEVDFAPGLVIVPPLEESGLSAAERDVEQKPEERAVAQFDEVVKLEPAEEELSRLAATCLSLTGVLVSAIAGCTGAGTGMT